MIERKLTDFEIEEKTSGGAVYEAGVKESKRSKALRRIAQPLMDKYWNCGNLVSPHRSFLLTHSCRRVNLNSAG